MLVKTLNVGLVVTIKNVTKFLKKLQFYQRFIINDQIMLKKLKKFLQVC